MTQRLDALANLSIVQHCQGNQRPLSRAQCLAFLTEMAGMSSVFANEVLSSWEQEMLIDDYLHDGQQIYVTSVAFQMLRKHGVLSSILYNDALAWIDRSAPSLRV